MLDVELKLVARHAWQRPDVCFKQSHARADAVTHAALNFDAEIKGGGGAERMWYKREAEFVVHARQDISEFSIRVD